MFENKEMKKAILGTQASIIKLQEMIISQSTKPEICHYA